MTYIDDVAAAAREWDAARPRSSQEALGWSEMEDCAAVIAFKVRGVWPSDDTDTARMVIGSVLHDWWADIMAPRHPGRIYEADTLYRGVPGHADEVDPDEPSVTDLKTKALKSVQALKAVPRGARRENSRWRGMLVQVHGYYAGLVDGGVLPQLGTVRLLFIPVDGQTRDWYVHEEPFDRSLPDEALARYDDIKARTLAGERVPCSENLAFCAGYCPYYSIRPAPPTEGAPQ